MAGSRGQWIETCGCGRKTYVKNLRYRVAGTRSMAPCGQPHPHDPDDPPNVTTEAGWCGCGEPEIVDRLMLDYLEVAAVHGALPERLVMSAYLAAELDWTEHGGSIYGAWLTDDGTAVLQELRSRFPSTPEEAAQHE